ncbi:amino acid ABC transporter permease [Sphaerimonospora sp. CA-214678]|uniref:amino acid ABC transporter permease n=1 Tax=Sphaerimonospora sp. CA-214678 TaxID=3240029 RepID=UPI003D8A210A
MSDSVSMWWSEYLPMFAVGAWRTIQLTVMSMLLATVLGLLIAVVRRMRVPGLSQLLAAFVQVMRLVPELVLLFLVYYSLPELGILLSAFVSAVLVFGVHYSAFLSEVFRGGLEAIPHSQVEASKMLQLGKGVMWRRVILPQAVRNVIPTWGNYLQTVIKASALAGTITYGELFFQTNFMANQNFRYFELFTVAAAIYFVMSWGAAKLQHRLEKSFARERRKTA